MADIAMCSGTGCELREQCFRYTAPISDIQPVISSVPDFPVVKRTKCEFFWDNAGYPDGRAIGKWWRNG